MKPTIILLLIPLLFITGWTGNQSPPAAAEGGGGGGAVTIIHNITADSAAVMDLGFGADGVFSNSVTAGVTLQSGDVVHVEGSGTLTGPSSGSTTYRVYLLYGDLATGTFMGDWSTAMSPEAGQEDLANIPFNFSITATIRGSTVAASTRQFYYGVNVIKGMVASRTDSITLAANKTMELYVSGNCTNVVLKRMLVTLTRAP